MPQMPTVIRAKTKRRQVLFIPKSKIQNRHNRSDFMTNGFMTTLRDSSQSPSVTEQKRSKSMRKSSNDGLSVSQIEQVAKLGQTLNSTEHIGLDSETVHSVLSKGQANLRIPQLFTTLPPIRDHLETETSILQDETAQECLPLLAGPEDSSRPISDFNAHGLPRLKRAKHVEFLHRSLEELSSRHVGYDASRPWIIYWVLLGLCLLGEDVKQYRERFSTLTYY